MGGRRYGEHLLRMTKTRTRESWIDWSKAILIWLMVLGHAGLHLPYSSVASSLLVMLLCYYPIKWANQHCPILLGK